jgi:hypothetical protein
MVPVGSSPSSQDPNPEPEESNPRPTHHHNIDFNTTATQASTVIALYRLILREAQGSNSGRAPTILTDVLREFPRSPQ